MEERRKVCSICPDLANGGSSSCLSPPFNSKTEHFWNFAGWRSGQEEGVTQPALAEYGAGDCVRAVKDMH